MSGVLTTGYRGSTLLMPLSEAIGLRLDQVNFAVCQLFALFASFLMRKYLPPSIVSENTRYAFTGAMGVLLVYFCFGSEIWYILALAVFCYIVIVKVDPKHSSKMVFVVSMVYLTARHIQRMVYHYGSYYLDVTGPLMIIVQKVTGLAFSLHDGLVVKDENLTPFRRKHVVRELPTFLQFYGYIFQYQCVLAGPNVFYVDYVNFIKGENFKATNDKVEKGGSVDNVRSVTSVVIEKVAISFTCIGVYLALRDYFPVSTLKEPDFLNSNFFYKMWYLHALSTLTRFMYYHAWVLADAICNAAGFGFSGYDENGKPVWDLTTNVKILEFERGENLRAALNTWNINTSTWLRFMVYERMKKYNTISTFMLSAVWHGLYPGYYNTFVTAAMFIATARVIRRYVRPYFLTSRWLKGFYDVVTILATRMAITYVTTSFMLLEFWPSYYVYKSVYFFMHILGLLAYYGIPAMMPKPRVE